MTWKVRIIGDARDLEELQKSFVNSNISISKETDGFYLTSDSFNNCSNHNNVLEIASSILPVINGASKLALGGNIQIKESGVIKENRDGTQQVFMAVSDSLTIRDSFVLKIIDNEGQLIQEIHPADEVPNWVTIGLQDSSVEKVFRLYGQGLDWVGLYRIYEVIECDVNGMDTIIKNGWASKRSIKVFKRTANSPSIIGDDARHGKEPSQPPVKPMLFSEARNLIESLILQWIKNKTTVGEKQS